MSTYFSNSSAPSRVLPIDENLIATGDDDGVVRLWDPRRRTTGEGSAAVQSYDHHYDWITDLLWCDHLEPPISTRDDTKRRKQDDGSGRSRLVCTSGDGTLSVIDVRARRNGVETSDDQEDELLSVAAVKGGKRLAVGTQLGVLSLWAPARGILDHIDRFPGHPASVDTMCTLDEDTILTGSSDGLIRVVQLFPHKLLGIVGEHNGMPVERLTRKGELLSSIGHGSEVKMTNLAPLLEGGSDDEDQVPLVQATDIGDAAHTARSTEASDDSDIDGPRRRRRQPSRASQLSGLCHADFFDM